MCVCVRERESVCVCVCVCFFFFFFFFLCVCVCVCVYFVVSLFFCLLSLLFCCCGGFARLGLINYYRATADWLRRQCFRLPRFLIGPATEWSGPLCFGRHDLSLAEASRKVATLRASLSGTFLQTLPELVTPLKGHSLYTHSENRFYLVLLFWAEA